MTDPKSYDFKPIPPVRIGMGMTKWWGVHVRELGQQVFLEAVMELPEDLPEDPWAQED